MPRLGMSLELKGPVRLQADFAAPPGAPPQAGASWLDGPDAGKGMAAILEAGLFFLQLGYPPGPENPVARERFLDLLGRAASSRVRVSVILREPTISAASLAQGGAAEVALDLTGDPGFPGKVTDRLRHFLGEYGAFSRERFKIGAVWRPARGSMKHLPLFLEAAAVSGIDFIELPPLPLAYYPPREAAAAVPGPAEYRSLAAAMRGRKGEGITDLRVHDLLLSAVVSPLRQAAGHGSSRFGGCQAAGALGYVDPEGMVLPCTVLRRPLGRVADLAAPGFWQRSEATAAREWALRPTPACRQCRVIDQCRGGCPGTRMAVLGDSDAPDPLCDVVREVTVVPLGNDG